jgi:hypothetical protein
MALSFQVGFCRSIDDVSHLLSPTWLGVPSKVLCSVRHAASPSFLPSSPGAPHRQATLQLRLFTLCFQPSSIPHLTSTLSSTHRVLMGLIDLVVFLVAASLAHRAYPPKSKLNGQPAMATQQAKREHDRVLFEMSSPSAMRGDEQPSTVQVPQTQYAQSHRQLKPNVLEGRKPAREYAPESHRQQQQERPMTGQKRKAKMSLNSETPAKRRAPVTVVTPSKPSEKVSLQDRILDLLKLQSLESHTGMDNSYSLTQFASMYASISLSYLNNFTPCRHTSVSPSRLPDLDQEHHRR